jgi:hypothetical protein
LVVQKNFKPWQGRQKITTEISFVPSGALFVWALIPTVSPWAAFGRRSATSTGFGKYLLRRDGFGVNMDKTFNSMS